MPIDKTAAPTPPPARKPTQTASQTKAVAKIEVENAERRKRSVDGVNSIASAIQMGLLATKQTADAGAINRHGPSVSNAIVDYAEGNDKFGASLDRLSDVSPLAGIMMACVPLVLQVAVNHNLFGLKAEQLATAGVVTPATLVSESNEYLMQMQTEAMRREIIAAQEMQQTHAEFVQMQQEAQAANDNASE
jgi:hypothetical protein